MRWFFVLCVAALLGCDDDDLRYSDGSEWQNVSLSPGGSIPRDMREWSAWARAQNIITNQDIQTWTPTAYVGFSVDPTGSFRYVDFKTTVMLWTATEFTGTSDDVVFQITGLPETIRPDALVSFPVWAYDNGVYVLAMASIASNGTVQFDKAAVSGTAVGALGSWTGAGNKGLLRGTVLWYPKDVS